MLSYTFLLALMSCALTYAQTTTITCDDAYECQNQNLTYTYVNCYGYFGCYNAVIDDTTTYAYGAYGAYLADISSTRIYNYGFRASYFATISTSYFYDYGYYGGYFATIKAATIYSYGYFSSMFADISPLSSTLNVYFYGYYAGYYADVVCSSGDTCKIYCGSSYGCYSTKFYCYSGATCYYNCDDDPNYCPTLYGGVEDETSDLYLTDNEIKAIYNKNSLEKKNRAEAEKKGKMFGKKKAEIHDAPVLNDFAGFSPNVEHPDVHIDDHYDDDGIIHGKLKKGKTFSYGLVTVISVALISFIIGMLGVYVYMVKRYKFGYVQIANTVELI